MVLLGEEAHVEDRFSPFRDSGNIDARWVHGLRRTYHRLRNHFGRPDGTPMFHGSCGMSFGPFGEGVSADVR